MTTLILINIYFEYKITIIYNKNNYCIGINKCNYYNYDYHFNT